MLEKVDLTSKTKKAEFESTVPDLELKLGELQRQARDLGIPVTIVFEGWSGSGKGTLINKLLLCFDSRGFTVFTTKPPTEEERFRPFLWRFWTKTPERGRMAIFDRSWYGRFLVERMEETVEEEQWTKAYDEVKSFEKQLIDDGNVIIKFFLHITKGEQKKRLKKLEGNPSTAWRVTESDWKKNKQYERYLQATEEMLVKTDTYYAPWTIVEAQDWRFATLKLYRTVIATLESKIEEVNRARRSRSKANRGAVQLEEIPSSVLEKVDLSLDLKKGDYGKALKKYQSKVRELEHQVYMRRLPVVIVYSGWDAAGKGGNIRRIVQAMDPRGYEVISIAAPNDIEKAHHYLWRFWSRIPKAGHIAIFDRSWYERVMVERVEGFCAEEEWKRAYGEINEFEEQLTNFGTVLVKFWLQIDQDEQLRRFQARQKIPFKQWKITDEDWRNREKWDRYRVAVEEMLFRTSTPYAPWTIVEANSKRYARIKALRTVCEEIEKHLKS